MPIDARPLALFLMLALPIAHAADQEEPLSVVQKRTKAMVEHDFPQFMSTYADGVELFVYPDRPLGKGKEHVSMLFAPMFKSGDFAIEVNHQTVADSFVVFESTLSFADKSERTVAIYEVRDGLIQSVRFLRDNLRATQTYRNVTTSEQHHAR